MKCARLHLQQRSKGNIKSDRSTLVEKPRRYCQKRLVNPSHEEDPRWIDTLDRFHCNFNQNQLTDILNSRPSQQDTEDIVLTVQTLKFQGNVDQTKRPRTSFKYKKNTEGNKHRMFVKQFVSDYNFSEDDRSSDLTYYYFDDYVKYLYNNHSRPTSGKSSILFREFSQEEVNENKPTQAENNPDETKTTQKPEPKTKTLAKTYPKQEMKDVIRDDAENIDNTKIMYQKTGKRKSLMISRTQSPETVQVIRVDVVCNYPTSVTSDYDENKKFGNSSDRSESNIENTIKNNYLASKYTNYFANRYLLTNTIRSLDENLSGGAKVTLLCKTFKLSDRTKASEKMGKEKNYAKTHTKAKKGSKTKIQLK